MHISPCPQLNLPRKFARIDALGKGWLHAHEVAALVKVALPGSTGPERHSMVLQSYDPSNGGVTFAGGNVTLQVRFASMRCLYWLLQQMQLPIVDTLHDTSTSGCTEAGPFDIDADAHNA